jgi:hypothetical protein
VEKIYFHIIVITIDKCTDFELSHQLKVKKFHKRGVLFATLKKKIGCLKDKNSWNVAMR